MDIYQYKLQKYKSKYLKLLNEKNNHLNKSLLDLENYLSTNPTSGELEKWFANNPTDKSALENIILSMINKKNKNDQYIKTFDELDFIVFTHQQWIDFHKSHSNNVIVHFPDGHATYGLDKHIEDLKWMFTYAPDTAIYEHPVKFGYGEWTAVIGRMSGTFTKEMITHKGKIIKPTFKSFSIPMCTISHWNGDGVMDEEYLFWDNLTYYKQMGIEPSSLE